MAHTKKHTLFFYGVCFFVWWVAVKRSLCVRNGTQRCDTPFFDLRSFWVFEPSVYIMAEKKGKVSFYGGMWWIIMTC